MAAPRKYDISDDELLDVITTSHSWNEIAERTGYAPTTLYPRVAQWKSKGILADSPVAVKAEYWKK